VEHVPLATPDGPRLEIAEPSESQLLDDAIQDLKAALALLEGVEAPSTQAITDAGCLAENSGSLLERIFELRLRLEDEGIPSKLER